MKTKISLLLLASLFIVFSSCKDDIVDDGQNQDIEVENQIERLVYPVPTPFETAQMLQSAGASYISGIINDFENADNYFKEKSQALNLGVYGSDLAYASTYNQAQVIRDILASTKKLSDQLGLSNVVDQNIIARVEQNIDNEDTLYKIVNNTYYDTFNKLNSENKGAVAMLVISGAWIESIYISTQLAITSSDFSILAQKIAEQKYTLNAMLPIIEQYETENQDIAEILLALHRFNIVFDKVEQNEDGDVSMTDDQLVELMEIGKEEREKIVNMQ